MNNSQYLLLHFPKKIKPKLTRKTYIINFTCKINLVTTTSKSILLQPFEKLAIFEIMKKSKKTSALLRANIFNKISDVFWFAFLSPLNLFLFSLKILIQHNRQSQSTNLRFMLHKIWRYFTFLQSIIPEKQKCKDKYFVSCTKVSSRNNKIQAR